MPDPSAAHRPSLRELAASWRERRRRRRTADEEPRFIPVDPRLVLTGELDPELLAIRAALRPLRRRLWLRRTV
ncbi:MAG TPA: hypothetical protein VK831_07535, partial [Candidatus Deferrimicrobiaceae bacterium]|nr:hypothetical protein [Candidatus Deferrimicrobiaceae bacterium]